MNSTEEALDGSTTTTTTEAPKIPCDGKAKVCVEPNQCVKGFIDGNTLSRNYNYVSNRLFFGVKDADVVIPVMCINNGPFNMFYFHYKDEALQRHSRLL